MRVAQKFAGYTLDEADNLRKACGKKIRALIAAEREKFVAGCVATGYERAPRHRRCSTSSSRSPTTPSTSPTPTATGSSPTRRPGSRPTTRSSTWPALLTSVKDNKDKTAVYLAECRAIGIEVLVPDVNRSAAEFAPRLAGGRGRRRTGSPGAIVFGLAAVRNVGEGLVERIVAEREHARPLRRLLRLLPAGRPPGAQQADHGVAGQGRRLRLPRPPPPGPLPGASRRSSTGPSSAGGSTTPASPPSSPPSSRPTAEDDAGRWEGTRVPDPRHSSSTSPSGWPSRRRCSASTSATTRSWASRGALPATPTAPWPSCATPGAGESGGGRLRRRRAGPDGGRGGHRAQAPVHEEGRPHGHASSWRTSRPRWRCSSSRRSWPSTGRCSRTTPSWWCEGRVDLRDERAQAGGHGDPAPGASRGSRGRRRAADLPAPRGPLTDGDGGSPQASCWPTIRAPRRSSSTWARRCSACPRSSTWTARNGLVRGAQNARSGPGRVDGLRPAPWAASSRERAVAAAGTEVRNRHMPIGWRPRTAPSLSDAELAEMADLCAEREPRVSTSGSSPNSARSGCWSPTPGRATSCGATRSAPSSGSAARRRC